MKFQEQEERERKNLVGRSLKSIQESRKKERWNWRFGQWEKPQSWYESGQKNEKREEKHGAKKEKAPNKSNPVKKTKPKKKKENPFMDFNDFSIPIIKISQLTFQFFLSYTISESRLRKTNSSPSLSSSQLFPSFITFVCFWLGFPIFFFVFFFFLLFCIWICNCVDLSYCDRKRTDTL